MGTHDPMRHRLGALLGSHDEWAECVSSLQASLWTVIVVTSSVAPAIARTSREAIERVKPDIESVRPSLASLQLEEIFASIILPNVVAQLSSVQNSWSFEHNRPLASVA